MKDGSAYDAIVIGSGLSGLTTARFLAECGKRVLIVEKHNVAGGMTHTFKRQGYEWDVGLHYLGGDVGSESSVIRWMFDYITDGNLQWAEMDEVFDRIQIAGDHYEIGRGRKEQEARIVSHFPDEAAAIKKYFELVQSVAMRGSFFFGEKSMPPWLSFIMGKPFRHGFAKYTQKTTYEVLRSLTSNEKLISVLSAQCGDYGLAPRASAFAIHAMVVEHYLRGGFYPVGGGGRIFQTIKPGLDKLGVEIKLSAAVEEILLDRGRVSGVRLASGERLLAPIVVSGAGVRNTFEKFLPATHPFVEKVRADLQTIAPSTGHVCLYAGFNKGDAELKLPKCNYWLYDSYDFDAEFARFNRQGGRPAMAYLSFGSARDAGWKHPERSTMQVIAPCNFASLKQWHGTSWHKRGQSYEDFKAEQQQWLLQRALDIVPQIQPHIDHLEVSTPLTTRHFGGAPSGEMYGLEHTPGRFALPWLRPRTKIQGLFLTGQDTVAVGVTSALFSGLLTAVSILDKNLMWRVWRRHKYTAGTAAVLSKLPLAENAFVGLERQ